MTQPGAKLTKLVAHQLRLSRRAAEKFIYQKGVMVDNKPIHQPEYMVLPHQHLNIDGVDSSPELPVVPCQVLLYHKQQGEVCAPPPAHPSVFNNLPKIDEARWIMVGRLDINTSGLLLFTTHGPLAYRLMHPKYRLDREYAVRIHGRVSKAMIDRLTTGVKLADGMARFHDLVAHKPKPNSANQWFYLVVQSGRYRMVRRLWESQGLQVSRLIRVRYANIALASQLKAGQYTLLTNKQRQSLMDCVNYEA